MTTALSTRGALRRTVRLVVAGTALLAAVQGAAASDDAGLHQFFSAIFGGGASQPAAAPPPRVAVEPAYAPVRVRALRPRALTVRLRPAKPRVVVAQAPVKPGKVSIFEDRTLRQGDAVMTAQGVRVFAGSSSWPYRSSDFVGLDEARHMSQDTTRVLAQLDKLPRG